MCRSATKARCRVTTDDREGARHIVAYLRSRGRHRIATITGPLHLPGGVQRLAGYQDATGTAFDPALIVHGDYTYDSGAAATARLLHQIPDLDAIFVASDMTAAGALATWQHAGRRVPDDVAVAGYDDAPIATRTQPQLTTIRIRWQRYPGQLTRDLRQTHGRRRTIRDHHAYQPHHPRLRLKDTHERPSFTSPELLPGPT